MSALTEGVTSLAQAVGAVDSLWLLVGLLLVVNAWAISLVLWSGATAGEKALWCVVILAVPILGPVAWYVLGPKPDLFRGRASAGANTQSKDGGP